MAININNLLGRQWVHSHEENSGNKQVFRPSSYELPPSRGRFSFELRPDGSMVRHGWGATDRSQRAVGTWKLEGDKLFLSTATDRETPRGLKILSVSADRLEVEM